MSNKGELYSLVQAIENEHCCIEKIVRDFCAIRGMDCVYYRKLKRGHVPTFREFKIRGNELVARQLHNMRFESRKKGRDAQYDLIKFMEEECKTLSR